MNHVTIRCHNCVWMGNFGPVQYLPSRTLGPCPWCGKEELKMRITNYKQILGL